MQFIKALMAAAAIAAFFAAPASADDTAPTRAADEETDTAEAGASPMDLKRGTTTTTETEYGKDGKKGGNVEFEWKVEEGE